MPSHYTDVEKLLLQRWSDVRALITAYGELQNSLEEMLNDLGEELEAWAKERGYEFETDARSAEFQVWKPEWANRRGDAGVWLTVGGFVPEGYRKLKGDHPYLWVGTALENLRVKASLHSQFARELRGELGEAAKDWQDPEVEDVLPLGRHLKEYDDPQRVQWMMSPSSLAEFVKGGFEQLFPLAQPISKVLGSYR
jgi:hypothetical protein